MNHNYWRAPAQHLMAAVLTLIMTWPAIAQEISADDFRNSRFRGFNLDGIRNNGRSEVDLDALAKTGANMVRIGVPLKRCGACVSYDLAHPDLATLDRLINALAKRSIYVLIVLVPGGDERGPFWTSPALQASFIDQWKILAARYKDSPNVAGFDLLNEPVPPGRTYADRQSQWLAYAETLGKEIRTVDPSRVLIVESAPDATASSFSTMRPLLLDNVVYSFHSYSPFALTHQGVAEEASELMTYGTTPDMDVNPQKLFRLLAIVQDFASKHNVPVLVGEFSIVKWAPQGSAKRYISDSLYYFEAKGWSWMYHDFRGWPGWDAEIDTEFTKRSANAPVIKILRAKMLKNIKRQNPTSQRSD